MLHSFGVDTGGSKGERETKDHLEKDCREGERDKAGWKSWNVAKAAARNREYWAKSVTALCAYWRQET